MRINKEINKKGKVHIYPFVLDFLGCSHLHGCSYKTRQQKQNVKIDLRVRFSC